MTGICVWEIRYPSGDLQMRSLHLNSAIEAKGVYDIKTPVREEPNADAEFLNSMPFKIL